MKKAIVIGASGLIGSHLLDSLLNDDRYSKVVTIGRRKLEKEHTKLSQATGDLFDMSAFAAEFQDGDDLFIAIGSTMAKTPDKKLYEKIDLGIPKAAAEMASSAGIKNACTVSSMGANTNSRVFYAGLKGRMEDAVLNTDIANNTIVRPSMLLGPRQEKRFGETVGKKLMVALDFMIPAKSKAIHVETVAKAMIALNNMTFSKPIWTNDELFDLAKTYQD